MYRAVDYYENYGVVGIYETKIEAIEALQEWVSDTDGECEVEIIEE